MNDNKVVSMDFQIKVIIKRYIKIGRDRLV